jgi:hypothetical protein
MNNATSCGLPCHYPAALPGRMVNVTIDGCLDQGPRLTAAEFRMLFQEERDEMDRLASGLKTYSNNKDKLHIYDGDSPPRESRFVTIIEEPTAPRRAEASIQRGGTSVIDLTGGPAAPGASILHGPRRMHDESAPDSDQDLWYGLTEQRET